MSLEIERKFLVKNDGWRGLAPGIPYRQGYLSIEPERTVRVRLAADSAFLTIKGRNEDGAAPEYEYPIPLADAGHMLDTMAKRPLIEKIRYTITSAGRIWEVDEFLGENAGLILAEVELEQIGQSVALPDWIGEEVTGDPRYYNSSLVEHPFGNWRGLFPDTE